MRLCQFVFWALLLGFSLFQFAIWVLYLILLTHTISCVLHHFESFCMTEQSPFFLEQLICSNFNLCDWSFAQQDRIDRRVILWIELWAWWYCSRISRVTHWEIWYRNGVFHMLFHAACGTNGVVSSSDGKHLKLLLWKIISFICLRAISVFEFKTCYLASFHIF